MEELPTFRKILLATDGSDASARAARHAVALARQCGATLTVMYVVETHQAFRLGIHQHEALHEMRREGERTLAEAARLARQAGLDAETDLCEGRAGETIVRQAEASGADLIVLGSHGQGALGDILLGSVSQFVLHRTQIPVLIVGPGHHR